MSKVATGRRVACAVISITMSCIISVRAISLSSPMSLCTVTSFLRCLLLDFSRLLQRLFHFQCFAVTLYLTCSDRFSHFHFFLDYFQKHECLCKH